MGPKTVDANSSEVSIRRKDTSTAHVQSPEGPSEEAQVEYAPNVVSTEGHSQARGDDVSYSTSYESTITLLTGTGAHKNGPPTRSTVATSTHPRTEDSVRPEVCVTLLRSMVNSTVRRKRLPVLSHTDKYLPHVDPRKRGRAMKPKFTLTIANLSALILPQLLHHPNKPEPTVSMGKHPALRTPASKQHLNLWPWDPR